MTQDSTPRRVAPWRDHKENKLREGDTIVHPDGTTAVIVYDELRPEDARWRAVYSDGQSLWLGLQLGGRGLAVLESTTAGERECGNRDCEWKGATDRMLGGIGPLCPECGETTESIESASDVARRLVRELNDGTAGRDEQAWMREASSTLQRLAPAVGSQRFVQHVPDHCDRIVWRGRYHHLPLSAPPAATPAAPSEVTDEQIRSLWQTTDTGDIEDDIMSFARSLLAQPAPVAAGKLGDGATIRCRKCGEQNAIEFNSARIVTHNPHTGRPRDARDIASDPEGKLIVAPGEALVAAAPAPASEAVAEEDASIRATNHERDLSAQAWSSIRPPMTRIAGVSPGVLERAAKRSVTAPPQAGARQVVADDLACTHGVDRAVRRCKQCEQVNNPVAQVVAIFPPEPDGHGVNWLVKNQPKPGTLLYLAAPPQAAGKDGAQ